MPMIIGQRPLDGVLSANQRYTRNESPKGILNRNHSAGGENSIQRPFTFLRKFKNAPFMKCLLKKAFRVLGEIPKGISVQYKNNIRNSPLTIHNK
jgi:hypothetical protein